MEFGDSFVPSTDSQNETHITETSTMSKKKIMNFQMRSWLVCSLGHQNDLRLPF